MQILPFLPPTWGNSCDQIVTIIRQSWYKFIQIETNEKKTKTIAWIGIRLTDSDLENCPESFFSPLLYQLSYPGKLSLTHCNYTNFYINGKKIKPLISQKSGLVLPLRRNILRYVMCWENILPELLELEITWNGN